MEDIMKLIVDFYKDLAMLGPSDNKESKKALDKMNIDNGLLKIMDIGCGTGSQSLFLAKELNCKIIAVDFLQPFLDELNKKAKNIGLNIQTICEEMDNLPFSEQSFDIIWSEGAIYNIGFNNGIKYLKKYLKPNGYLAVTEISWLKDNRPKELEEYWNKGYAEIDTIENKIQQLKDAGYCIIDHFTLPNYCWDNYYKGVKNNIEPFIERWENDDEAKEFIKEIHYEIEMYEKYKEYYSYEFYIVKNII